MSETLSVIVHKTIETNPLSVSSEIGAPDKPCGGLCRC